MINRTIRKQIKEKKRKADTTCDVFDNFGNFNYGVTGEAAGIPLYVLLAGAGMAQGPGTGRGIRPLQPPYGDRWMDRTMIIRGWDWARQFEQGVGASPRPHDKWDPDPYVIR